jgi:hypothetical protein
MAFMQNGFKPPRPPGAPQVNPYNTFRQQAEQRAGAQIQQNQNALQRRFAQLGGGPSGAQMKMEQEVQRQGNEDLNNQIGSINAQEAQTNTQADQFNRQFGLEQMKTLGGLDLARRQSALDEQGQFFNQAQAQLSSGYNAPRYEQEIARYQGLLNNQGDFGGYVNQLQTLTNPMLRRLQAPQALPEVSNG